MHRPTRVSPPDAILRTAIALHQDGRIARARKLYEQVLKREPEHFDALHLLGVIEAQSRNLQRAIQLMATALTVDPTNGAAYAAHMNIGLAHKELKQLEAALCSFDRAIAIRSDVAESHFNRGNALHDMNRYEAAIESYDRAIALNADCKWLIGNRCHARMQLCDWRGLNADTAAITAKIARLEAASDPFIVLTLADSPSLQRTAAEIWVRETCPDRQIPPWRNQRTRRGKIRIGYFSADFREHPVARLIAEMIETHDRTQFEVIAFSFGPDKQDDMRRRLQKAFDRFIEVGSKSDSDVALLARDQGIDIAVDLGGFTAYARPGIFAFRAAPLQVSYIGYLGTMGAPYMDYLIADVTIIPPSQQRHYSEKIVYLPSYQPNDSRRRIADKAPTRQELGLPQAGFVFCCFNSNSKITPSTFDSWMRILKESPDSVLMLYARSEPVEMNLRKECAKRGIDPGRLVFGKKLPAPEYLARYQTADLFLDTLPYNAGTTASDALWAGLPVLTRIGETFAGRIAASVLLAIGLPMLIVTTAKQYEDLAIELAGNPERLAAIRRTLVENRFITPLFNTPLHTKRVECAFVKIYERYLAGLPAEHIYIEPVVND